MKHSLFRFTLLVRPLVQIVATASILLFDRTVCWAAPANDNLVDAQVLPGESSFSVNGTDNNATVEPFEKTADYPVVSNYSVWYTWKAPVSGTLVVQSPRPTGNFNRLAIYKGLTPSAASFLAYDYNAASAYVEAGQEYRLSVSNETIPGPFVLSGRVTASPPPFFSGQTELSNSVYYLAFANGNFFGYYAFLSDPRYLYHFDLGYEYVFDAADGKSGLYLYDFASNTFFYTSPSFPFPYLYDFTLNALLYYYPDPDNAGRYNTRGVRYSYNFATKQIITK